MRRKPHVRCGGRAAETHQPKGRQGAAARPLHAMNLAAFIASQRTEHRVPHAVTCRAPDVNESWFYKWRDRPAHAHPAAPNRAGRQGEGDLRALRREPGHLRLTASARLAARSGLRRVGEDGGGQHGLPGAGRPAEEAVQVPDPAGQAGGAVPPTWSAATSRDRGHQPEVVRQHDRDPHRRGQALPGRRRGPVLPADRWLGHQRASRRRAGQGCAADRRCRAGRVG
jgi:hypothetical protein